MNKDPEFFPGDIVCTVGFTKLPDQGDWFEQEENEDLEKAKKWQEANSDFSGVPLVVIYQEFPFVLLQPATAPHAITSIDIRKYEFQIMTKTYLDKWKQIYRNQWDAWEREQNRAKNL